MVEAKGPSVLRFLVVVCIPHLDKGSRHLLHSRALSYSTPIALLCIHTCISFPSVSCRPCPMHVTQSSPATPTVIIRSCSRFPMPIVALHTMHVITLYTHNSTTQSAMLPFLTIFLLFMSNWWGGITYHEWLVPHLWAWHRGNHYKKVEK